MLRNLGLIIFAVGALLLGYTLGSSMYYMVRYILTSADPVGRWLLTFTVSICLVVLGMTLMEEK